MVTASSPAPAATVSGPRAEVVCDSVSPDGARVTTIEVTLHRFVLAELNTHRAFSRNSASSRAIPVQRQLDAVLQDPAVPLEFGANQRGMQAGPPLTGDAHDRALAAWLEARDGAVAATRGLLDLGVHKQVANRLLEPFIWHTVIVTATDWDGFWQQRCSPLAQPEIRAAADAMRTAYEASTPVEVVAGDWHTPYIRDEDGELDVETRKRVAAARCARVSYLTHDGRRDLSADQQLYDRLVTAEPPHWSPLEHVATPLAAGEPPLGNLRGWRQLRHVVERQRRTAAHA
ncbi:FAD-dependent thymidylate synthase [Egicoccus sp. AB-alg2]|uniref:FAD-dependent thymidylate synthase n=1 Tax=Egicoccus sp. AB-alg2 TaxID=3242693 RepID=UPI00359CDC46